MKANKNKKMIYWISSVAAVFVLVLGIFIGTNNISNNPSQNPTYQIADNKENKEKEENEKVELNINKVENPKLAKIDADVKNVNITNIPDTLANIKIPTDLDSKNYKAIYVKDENTGKYDKLYNYELSYTNTQNNQRSIMIAFSDTNKPLRDYYFEIKAKTSTIGNTELEIYQYENSYLVMFEHHNYKFDIETTGITENELVELLQSIITKS